MEEMNLIGFYSFSTKDKSKNYYIIQLLARDNNKTSNNLRGFIVNSFVNAVQFDYIINHFSVGDVLKVQSIVDYSTNKVRYHILLDDNK